LRERAALPIVREPHVHNFGDIDVAGIDYSIRYKFVAGAIQWRPSLSATQTYRYSVAFQPGQRPAAASVRPMTTVIGRRDGKA